MTFIQHVSFHLSLRKLLLNCFGVENKKAVSLSRALFLSQRRSHPCPGHTEFHFMIQMRYTKHREVLVCNGQVSFQQLALKLAKYFYRGRELQQQPATTLTRPKMWSMWSTFLWKSTLTYATPNSWKPLILFQAVFWDNYNPNSLEITTLANR